MPPATKLGPSSTTAAHATRGLGCESCAFLGPCGGVFDRYDCMGDCCGDTQHCTFACPRSERFEEVFQDCGGLDSSGPWSISQQRELPVPGYIPMVQHGYRRDHPLSWPIIALPTFLAARILERIGNVANPAERLRQEFRVASHARVVLVSVAPDRKLERFWQSRRRRNLIDLLSRAGADHITAPNFSFFRDLPRTDHLANRRRTLICAEEFSRAGLSVIPHLNAATEHDWAFWRDFLRGRPEISLVCKEFQTGPALLRIAAWHIAQLCELEQALGRGLHLVAIGGLRHLRSLTRLSGLTVIDSGPFMKTCFRRIRSARGWRLRRTRRDECLSQILLTNVFDYSERFDSLKLRCCQLELCLTSPEAGREHRRTSEESEIEAPNGLFGQVQRNTCRLPVERTPRSTSRAAHQ